MWRAPFSEQFFQLLPSSNSPITTKKERIALNNQNGASIELRKQQYTKSSSLKINFDVSYYSQTDGMRRISGSKSAEPQFTALNNESDHESEDDEDERKTDTQSKWGLSTLGALHDVDSEMSDFNIEESEERMSMPGADGRSIKCTEQKKENITQLNIDHVLTVIDYHQFWEQINSDDHDRTCKSCRKYKWIYTVCMLFALLASVFITACSWLSLEERSYAHASEEITPSSPICDLEYDEYLTAVDLVYLTIVAQHDQEEIENDFAIWFGAYNPWTIQTINSNFYHAYHSIYDIDVISIHSETTLRYLLQHLSLWSEASMLQLFSNIISLDKILPKTFLQQFIEFMSIFEHIIAPNTAQTFDEPIYEYIAMNIINSNKTRTNDSSLLILGHSMGGAIAQIVGAQLYENGYADDWNIKSFALSSPGTMYSSSKFRFGAESLDATSVSTVARRDIVTNIDEYGGLMQHLQCTADKDVECHGSVTSLCELHTQCRDKMVRNDALIECLCTRKGLWEECISE